MQEQELIIKTDRYYTSEDYLKLDDNQDYEIIGGKLIVVPKPKIYHQKVVSRLNTIINNFLEKNPVGEIYLDVDVFFNKQNVSPDLIFIKKERIPLIVTELNIQGAPDLVIEVLSPSTQKYDRKEKSRLYYDNGVKEYWIVDPAIQLVEVFMVGEKNWLYAGIYDETDILTSQLIPGLGVPLKNIF